MRIPCVLAVGFLALAQPRFAEAGACLSAQEDEEDLKALEAFAAPAAKPPGQTGGGWLCVELAAGADSLVDGDTGNWEKKLAERLRKRAVAACTKVLDRDGDGGQCVVILAATGLSKVGKHDVFALVGKLPEDPIDNAGGVGWTRTALYGQMDDPRGAAEAIAMWKDATPRADAREKRHREMNSWSGWRQVAARVIGKHGSASDIAFLEQQAAATRDTHVAQACRDAAAQIAKRTQSR